MNPAIGDEFDTDVHEAVMRVPNAQMPDSDPNTIAFVQQTGYNIKDQVLRPCWVGVVTEWKSRGLNHVIWDIPKTKLFLITWLLSRLINYMVMPTQL